MSIPASIKAVTVTGRYVKPDGSPAAGIVRFQLSAPAAVPADQAMVPLTSVKATLDAAGAFSVPLAASDDPDWAVSGLTYQVTERITGAELRTYNIAVPAASPGGTVNLASLAPAVPGPPLVSYVLAAAVGAPTGVASLDAAGQVPLSQLGNAPTGGGGAGAVDSVNGQVGAVMLDAADVGADLAGAAGSAVTAHTGAADPHGDRAYADDLVDALDQATTIALAGKADASHIHAAGDITSGTFAIGRLPVGAAADKVAAGDHTHPGGGGGIGGFRGVYNPVVAYNAGDIVKVGDASYGTAAGAAAGVAPVASTNLLTGIPAELSVVDGGDYEFGVRFTVSKRIRLTALCYYKSAAQTQSPHTLKLWDLGISTTAPLATVTPPGETSGATGVQAAPIIADLIPGRTYAATLVTGTGSDTGYARTTGAAPPAAGSVTADAFFFSTVIGNISAITTGSTNFWVWPRWEELVTAWDLLARTDPVVVGSARDVNSPIVPA